MFNNVFGGPAFAMETKWFTKKKIAGGGCILDTNSHSVDLFRYIVGEVADEKAVMHRHFKTTDVEDAGILIMKAENGALGSVGSGFVLGGGAAYIDVFGTKGRAIFDYYTPTQVKYILNGEENWTVQEIPACPSAGFTEEIAHFIGAIKGENKLAITVQDGVRAMEIICGVYD
jgi:predicted dehydrogenase